VKLVHKRREQAAQLVAEDRFPDLKIAEICEISEACLSKWKKRAEFAERVKELTAIYGERVLKYGLARRERRPAVLSEMHEKILTLIDARAEDPDELISFISDGVAGSGDPRAADIRAHLALLRGCRVEGIEIALGPYAF
jgi:hypothetical protein